MKKIILACFFLTLMSCQKQFVEGFANYYADSFRLHFLAKADKEVVYLPMIHISKPQFYAKVKHEVDSLRSEGYVIFYESIEADKDIDSLQKDLVFRKLRKIIGFFPDYSDKGQFKSLQIKGFIQQSKENTGIIDSIDTQADLPLNKLIASYEKEKGEVALSEYDLKTPFKKKYKARNVNQQNMDFLIDTLRNNHLIKMISESKAQKIAVVYGALHRDPLFTGLEKRDSLWYPGTMIDVKNSKLQKAVQ